MTTDPIKNAHLKLFKRYADACRHLPPWHSQVREARKEHVEWMCATAAREGDGWPVDKLARWLGYVQGILIAHGVTTVERERDATRPIFHEAYIECGIAPPASRDPST